MKTPMKSKTGYAGIVVALALFLSTCSGDVNGVPEPRSSSDENIAAGRSLIASYGCGSCHSIPGIPGADSMSSPPLERFYQRSYIAGRLPNTWENLTRFIQDPQQVEPGNAMPNLGITAEQAHDIAAYLYHPQPTIDNFIGH
jgi:cytochrome c